MVSFCLRPTLWDRYYWGNYQFRREKRLRKLVPVSEPHLWSFIDCFLNQDPHSLTMNVSLIRKSKHIPTILALLSELFLRFPGFWLVDFRMKPNPFLRPIASQVNCPVFISPGSSWTIFPIMHWSVWPFSRSSGLLPQYPFFVLSKYSLLQAHDWFPILTHIPLLRKALPTVTQYKHASPYLPSA